MASLTIIIPALNEESKIGATARGLAEVARAHLDDFQMILIDDGSTDGTGAAMEQVAREYPQVTVIHNAAPMGVGRAFVRGLEMARCEYMTLCPGDNAFSTELLPEIFRQIGKVDFVVTYRINQRAARKPSRYLISNLYNFVIRNLFWLPIRDMHSLNIYPVKIAREIAPRGESVGFQVELVVSLLRRKVSFKELPVTLNLTEREGRSTTIKWKTFVGIAKTIGRLFGQ